MAFCHGLYTEQTGHRCSTRQTRGRPAGPPLAGPAQEPRAAPPELPPFLPQLVPRLLPVAWGFEHATPAPCPLASLCSNTSRLVSDPSRVSLPRLSPFVHSANRGLASDPPWGLAPRVASEASASPVLSAPAALGVPWPVPRDPPCSIPLVQAPHWV